MMAHKIHLPDLEAGWKWPRRLNPYTEEIRQDREEWAKRFGAFTPEAQRVFEKCDFVLLTGLSYSWLTKDQLECACDMNNLFFIFDEHSDKSSPLQVWTMKDILVDALRSPHQPRPEGEWIGGEIARQFWTRMTNISTTTFQKRFLETWEQYLHGTAEQAEYRCSPRQYTIETYLAVRRKTIGVRPSLAMLEVAMDIPDEIMQCREMKDMELLVIDMTIIANDILSYNKEQAGGDDEHNLITVAMKEKNMDVQEAIDWAGNLYGGMLFQFNQLYSQFPRWGGPIDFGLQLYLSGMAQWVIGVIQWSYESERYFGKRGIEIKEARCLYLLPKIQDGAENICPVVVDDSLIL